MEFGPAMAQAPFLYLNTDLDLTCAKDLRKLAAVLNRRGFFSLHVTRQENGVWSAWFELETNDTYDEPEPNIASMLDVIETLAKASRDLWRACSAREFNVGYECGYHPWAFNHGFSSQLLRRIAKVGASLRITLYPPERKRRTKQSAKKSRT
jgi:hypothetical protein